MKNFGFLEKRFKFMLDGVGLFAYTRPLSQPKRALVAILCGSSGA